MCLLTIVFKDKNPMLIEIKVRTYVDRGTQ